MTLVSVLCLQPEVRIVTTTMPLCCSALVQQALPESAFYGSALQRLEKWRPPPESSTNLAARRVQRTSEEAARKLEEAGLRDCFRMVVEDFRRVAEIESKAASDVGRRLGDSEARLDGRLARIEASFADSHSTLQASVAATEPRLRRLEDRLEAMLAEHQLFREATARRENNLDEQRTRLEAAAIESGSRQLRHLEATLAEHRASIHAELVDCHSQREERICAMFAKKHESILSSLADADLQQKQRFDAALAEQRAEWESTLRSELATVESSLGEKVRELWSLEATFSAGQKRLESAIRRSDGAQSLDAESLGAKLDRLSTLESSLEAKHAATFSSLEDRLVGECRTIQRLLASVGDFASSLDPPAFVRSSGASDASSGAPGLVKRAAAALDQRVAGTAASSSIPSALPGPLEENCNPPAQAPTAPVPSRLNEFLLSFSPVDDDDNNSLDVGDATPPAQTSKLADFVASFDSEEFRPRPRANIVA